MNSRRKPVPLHPYKHTYAQPVCKKKRTDSARDPNSTRIRIKYLQQ